MSELSRKVNEFFNFTPKSEVNKVKDNINLTEHQKQVLEMKYIQGKDIDYIAYVTGYSKNKINADLRKIRKKIEKLI